MKKGFVPILTIIVVLVLAGVAVFSWSFLNNKSTETESTNIFQEKEPVVEKQTGIDETVPLLQEEDVINNFFALINEQKIPEAIAMMSAIMVPDDSAKQAWGVQFNDIKSINVLKIEPSMPESWSEKSHVYKVILEAYVSSDAENAPIPYYGWGDNPNLRWVEIVKEGELWKINSIATGP